MLFWLPLNTTFAFNLCAPVIGMVQLVPDRCAPAIVLVEFVVVPTEFVAGRCAGSWLEARNIKSAQIKYQAFYAFLAIFHEVLVQIDI